METTKKLNCIFEGREGNLIFVCATKTIVPGEELLIDCNLNRIDGGGAAMGVNILHTIQLKILSIIVTIYRRNISNFYCINFLQLLS